MVGHPPLGIRAFGVLAGTSSLPRPSGLTPGLGLGGLAAHRLRNPAVQRRSGNENGLFADGVELYILGMRSMK